ncbi:DUF1330 domain-containing protein [Rhizobium sp. Leaf371]|uniref:DUF1330 domain-containing protein n=1 Tax=Rhizobium sp. Leaf371 TaxID=1736355 RepID=UPI0009E7CC5C|nr:DUF1330 domain-containing protein [Rhizobium sp. Leaf371]
MDAARALYDSPIYQAAAEHRFIGATYRSSIIEGVRWTFPSSTRCLVITRVRVSIGFIAMLQGNFRLFLDHQPLGNGVP